MKRKVLCVCAGNTCRSPMMQALLQQVLGNEYEVESAGIMTGAADGNPANDNSILCMKERGIDLSQHRSRFAGNLDMRVYSHIVCVTMDVALIVRYHLPRESRAVIIVAAGMRGGVTDPYKKGLPEYRECLKCLDGAVEEIKRIILVS